MVRSQESWRRRRCGRTTYVAFTVPSRKGVRVDGKEMEEACTEAPYHAPQGAHVWRTLRCFMLAIKHLEHVLQRERGNGSLHLCAHSDCAYLEQALAKRFRLPGLISFVVLVILILVFSFAIGAGLFFLFIMTAATCVELFIKL